MQPDAPKAAGSDAPQADPGPPSYVSRDHQTYHPLFCGDVPLQAVGTWSRDLTSNQDSTLQANLIMPEPCEFISPNLPRCAVIRPTGLEQFNAGNAMEGFIKSGLFIGQPDEFTKLLLDMASEADAAHR